MREMSKAGNERNWARQETRNRVSEVSKRKQGERERGRYPFRLIAPEEFEVGCSGAGQLVSWYSQRFLPFLGCRACGWNDCTR